MTHNVSVYNEERTLTPCTECPQTALGCKRCLMIAALLNADIRRANNKVVWYEQRGDTRRAAEYRAYVERLCEVREAI